MTGPAKFCRSTSTRHTLLGPTRPERAHFSIQKKPIDLIKPGQGPALSNEHERIHLRTEIDHITGADPGGGGGGRSPLPIEMAPLGIMPPSEVSCRPLSLEWCRPRWRGQKYQQSFSSKVVPKKVNKNRPRHRRPPFDSAPNAALRPFGPCRPRVPGIMPPSDRRPPAYEDPGSAPVILGISGRPQIQLNLLDPRGQFQHN